MAETSRRGTILAGTVLEAPLRGTALTGAVLLRPLVIEASLRGAVVVRAALEYPVLVPITQFGDLANGNRLVMASAAFRTEPYRNSGN